MLKLNTIILIFWFMQLIVWLFNLTTQLYRFLLNRLFLEVFLLRIWFFSCEGILATQVLYSQLLEIVQLNATILANAKNRHERRNVIWRWIILYYKQTYTHIYSGICIFYQPWYLLVTEAVSLLLVRRANSVFLEDSPGSIFGCFNVANVVVGEHV